MKTSLIVTGLLFGGVLLAADFVELNEAAAKAAKEKDFVTAEAKYTEALEAAADPEQKTQAILGKFEAMRGQKRVKEAEEFLLSSVENPDIRMQDARLMLNTLAGTMLWWKGREDRALELLQQAQNCECSKGDNVYFKTYYLMAVLYRNKAQFQTEIDVLDNVLSIREQHPANLYTAHYMTGGAYEKLGKPEEALKHYRLALEFGKKVKYKFDYSPAEKAIERLSE